MTDVAIARGFGRMKWTELAENRAAVKATVAPEEMGTGPAAAQGAAHQYAAMRQGPGFTIMLAGTAPPTLKWALAMAYPSSAPRSRFAGFMRTWFNFARWTAADGFIALSGVVLAVAVFLPWFKAQVTIQGADGTITGTLFDPPGCMAALTAHGYLLVPLAVGLLQSAMIAARYLPSRRAPRMPFHRYILVAACAVDFLVVIAGALLKPTAWYGTLQMPPNFHVSVDWTYGTLIAAGAALLALGIAVTGLRPDGL
jgi:hypothetical protein